MFSKPTRNHITVIPEQIGTVGVIFITFIFTALYEAFSSGYNVFSQQFWLRLADSVAGVRSEAVLIGFAAAAAVALLAPVWLLLRWMKTVFYIDGEYLVSQRNTLIKKQSRLPLSSISTVNLERSVFERIVGTAKIKLDINSAATANKTDFTFVLSLEKAKAFEKELMRLKEEAPCMQESKKPERQLVYAFSKAQLVRHVLLSQPVVQFGVIGLMIAAGIKLDELYYAGQLHAELLSLGALTALGWASKAAAQLVSAWNFKVERNENAVFISSGLFKKKNYYFETEKINALTVRRPLLARLAGLACAEVAVIGLGNDSKETPQISLLLSYNELEKLLTVCAPDFICNSEKVREHSKGVIPGLLRCFAFCAVVALAVSYVWWAFGIAAFAVMFAVAAVMTCLRHRARSFSSDERVFSYSCGVLSSKSCFFKFEDIQTVQLRTDILMKRFGLGRIRLSILSSSAMSVHTTGWFETAVFNRLEQKIM